MTNRWAANHPTGRRGASWSRAAETVRRCWRADQPDADCMHPPGLIGPVRPLEPWTHTSERPLLGDRSTTVWCEYLRNTPAQVQQADPTGGLGLGSETEVRALAREPLAIAPRGLWRVAVEFDRVADFKSRAGNDALQAAGVQTAELIADDYGPCPTIAAQHASLG